MFEFEAEFAPEGGEGFGENPGGKDDGEDVGQSSTEAGEAECVGFDLNYVAVFFAECAVAEEGGEG